MDVLDFCSVTATIRQNVKENEDPGQVDFVRKLFETYMLDEETDIDEIEPAQACRWLKGQTKVSPSVATYYTRNNRHQYALQKDIGEYIVPLIFDIGMLIRELRDLVLNDSSISEQKKKELISEYETEGMDDSDDMNTVLAEFITNLIIFSLERPFMKRDARMKTRLIEGALSPAIADRIYTDDIPNPCPWFAGRTEEISALENLMENNSKVFVTGLAGIGKSELMKSYVKKHRKDFTNILYINYSGSLYDDITGLDFSDDVPGESTEIRFDKHNRFLRSLKEDSLIIIDNFNTTADRERNYSLILRYRCKILFTTRSVFGKKRASFTLKEIDRDSLIDLMKYFYVEEAEEKDILLGDIIDVVHSHTFAVELAARLLKYGMLTPSELLEKLREANVKIDSSDEIDTDKDGIYSRDTYYGHIQTLFALYELEAGQTDIMRCLCFVPKDGISSRLFAKWMGEKDLNRINELAETGFISRKNDYEVYLQPMMREISIADSRPSVSNCEEFLESLMEVFVQHGLDLSCYKTLFNVTEGIISIIEIDDEEKYLRFIEDAFASMQDYQWTSGLEMCINEMKNILEGGMIGDASDMVLLYDYQAFMEVSRGNYKDAAKFEEKALSFTEKTGDGNLLLLANVNANLGQDYMHLEMPSEAEKYLSVAIEIMKKTDMTRLNDLVPMQANYALLLQKKGELEKAKSILDNLKTIVGEMNSYNGKDYAFLEILTGNIYMGEGIVDMAEEHYQSARDIYADIYSDDPELIEIKDKEIMQLMAYFGSMHGKVIGRYLKGHLK